MYIHINQYISRYTYKIIIDTYKYTCSIQFKTHSRQQTHLGQFMGGLTLFSPPVVSSRRRCEASPVVKPFA